MNANRLRKYWLTPGSLMVLVCIVANTSAYAQNNDLWTAADRGDLPRVRELIADGADVNVKTDRGGTPLLAASLSGHLEVVQALLEKKADVNAKTNTGVTALIMASQNGHLAVVLALLDKEAVVNLKDNDGETALSVASQRGHLAVVALLETACPDALFSCSIEETYKAMEFAFNRRYG